MPSLRRGSTVIFCGVLLSLIVLLHPGGPANDHAKIFAEYSKSDHWTLIHLGQFAGMLLIVAGLVMLFIADDQQPRSWTGWLGVGLSIASLALYGALQAVDGVALKQAVDAWAHAPEAEKATHFAVAEAIRWTEWGMRSYHAFVLGLALLVLSATMVRTTGVPRPIRYLIGLSGLAYIAQGWIIGSEGFSAASGFPLLSGLVLLVVWSTWLLITAHAEAQRKLD